MKNFGHTVRAQQTPQQVVVLHRQVIYIVLALGLEDHIVETAYLHDEIHQTFREKYILFLKPF